MAPVYLLTILFSLCQCLETEENSSSFSDEAEKQKQKVEEELEKLMDTTAVPSYPPIRTSLNPKGWSPFVSATWNPVIHTPDDGRRKRVTPPIRRTRTNYVHLDVDDVNNEEVEVCITILEKVSTKSEMAVHYFDTTYKLGKHRFINSKDTIY